MIVEPVPASPRSPVRRGLRLAGIALPLVLLVAVVAAGSLGPKPAPTVVADVAARDPAASAAPAGVPAAPAGDATLVDFPGQVGALPVRTVTETLEAHRAGGLDGVVAVSGYLSIRDLPTECADRYLGPFGAFCERRTVLADASSRPFSSSFGDGSGFAGIGPHLHPIIPVGVRVPHQVVTPAIEPAPAADRSSATPVAVVVLGRFLAQDPAACATAMRHCGEAFRAERVAWVNGEEYPRTTTIDPGLDADWRDPAWRNRRGVARAAIGFDRTLLMTAYLQPATLALVDPRAALATVAAPGETPAAVWYVRALDYDPYLARSSSGGAATRVVWTVVDDATGQVIARGTEPAPGA